MNDNGTGIRDQDEVIAARLMLDKERQARAAACLAEIEAALQAHRCRIVAAPQIVDGRIVAVVQVVAEE